MSAEYPAFTPIFGNGPPGANTPRTTLYYDTSGASFIGYVYNGGWQVFGVSSNIDATSIQGVAVSATAPTTGQKLTYNGTQYVPQ